MYSFNMAAVLPLLLALAAAQQIGQIPEVHPKLPTQFCTRSGGCVTRQTKLVTDALSRPFHAVGNPSVSCASARDNKTLCPDVETCTRNCVLEGVDYTQLGVLTKGSAVTLRQYLFDGQAYTSVSPRLYLLAEDDKNYELLKLTNQELTYDVDLSQLGCGMNGALYLSEMEADGSRSDLNPAGAQYGTGYCDAQCYNVTWINGLPNLNNSGSCCNEMDIWEANSRATVLTPHTCNQPGSFLCAGDACGRGAPAVCDKSGCGINPYATGSKDFYAPDRTASVDTSRPFTVVTQFITADNTSAAPLTEIRRLYVQGGRVIENARVRVGGRDAPGVLTQDFCTERNASDFNRLGGVRGMGESLARGMVLIFSIWNSEGDFMTWLDSNSSGPCNATEGNPALIVKNNPEVSVTFSNIKWGEIGTTFNASSGSRAEAADLVSAIKAGTQSSAADRTLLSSALVGLAILWFGLALS
ncbi:uncharacterized protein E0L32_007054 [Thyridium curvatum]|uniref:Glucanase n=1 Tax=Thyridium curvatum TaxID=1093900 RepID=A0A507B5P1_9PEZI|nr:uncharacterized protein E0L32_007054 [Thyridium curvatum]TPX12168.1 hypothetical protein E0L32_007054 [Thyridium curvatum]